jgi:hypothetical protein
MGRTRGKLDNPNGIVGARLMGTAARYASTFPLNVDAALAELREIAQGRGGLRAEQAGLLLGAREPTMAHNWPTATVQAALLIATGAGVGEDRHAEGPPVTVGDQAMRHRDMKDTWWTCVRRPAQLLRKDLVDSILCREQSEQRNRVVERVMGTSEASIDFTTVPWQRGTNCQIGKLLVVILPSA